MQWQICLNFLQNSVPLFLTLLIFCLKIILFLSVMTSLDSKKKECMLGFKCAIFLLNQQLRLYFLLRKYCNYCFLCNVAQSAFGAFTLYFSGLAHAIFKFQMKQRHELDFTLATGCMLVNAGSSKFTGTVVLWSKSWGFHRHDINFAWKLSSTKFSLHTLLFTVSSF